MKCERCNAELRPPKKYQIVKCRCRAEYMMIEIGGTKTLEPMYREEVKDDNKKYK